jgi:putative ABC transport system ATP-binding protein
MALLTQLNQQGMTVVVVTHEPEVAAYASRTITFKDGRIIDDSSNKKVSSLGGLS